MTKKRLVTALPIAGLIASAAMLFAGAPAWSDESQSPAPVETTTEKAKDDKGKDNGKPSTTAPAEETTTTEKAKATTKAKDPKETKSPKETKTPKATATSTTPDDEDGKKVWVCKFVGKPYESEVIKGGKNPISVSVNSIKLPEGETEVKIGSEFADGQGQSVVIGWYVKGEAAPTIEDCEKKPSTPPSTTPSDSTSPSTTPSDSTSPSTTPSDDDTTPSNEPSDDESTPTDDDTTTPADDDDDTTTPSDDDDDATDDGRGVGADTGDTGDISPFAVLGLAGIALSSTALALGRKKK